VIVDFLPLLLLLLLYTCGFCLALFHSHAPFLSLSFAHAGAHECCSEMQILNEVVGKMNENISLPCVCYKTLIEKKLMMHPRSLCFNRKEERDVSRLIHGRSENVQDLAVGVATWYRMKTGIVVVQRRQTNERDFELTLTERNFHMDDLEACPCWGILEVVEPVDRGYQLGQSCSGYGPKKDGLANYR